MSVSHTPTQPRPHSYTRLALALVVAALVPAGIAIALLVSAAIRRPLLASLLASDEAIARRLTIAWGAALLVVAAAQGAVATAGSGSITSAGGFAMRTAIALALEAVLMGASALYLARSGRLA